MNLLTIDAGKWLDMALEAFRKDGGTTTAPIKLPDAAHWPNACRILPKVQDLLTSNLDKSVPGQVELKLEKGFTVSTDLLLCAMDMALTSSEQFRTFNTLGPLTQREIYHRVLGKKTKGRGAPRHTWEKEVDRAVVCASLAILYDFVKQRGTRKPLAESIENLTNRFELGEGTLASWWKVWNK